MPDDTMMNETDLHEFGSCGGVCAKCAAVPRVERPEGTPRVYIAGPMTGLPEFNYPAFLAAAEAWRAAGWEIENPATAFGSDQTREYRDYVKADLVMLRRSHALAVLPGWDGANARGSVWEREIAESILDLPIYDATQPVPAPSLPSGERAAGPTTLDLDGNTLADVDSDLRGAVNGSGELSWEAAGRCMAYLDAALAALSQRPRAETTPDEPKLTEAQRLSMQQSAPRTPAPDEPKSQVRINAESDPSYNPYCMRCSGVVRMQRVEPFFWRCACGAEHDERRTPSSAPREPEAGSGSGDGWWAVVDGLIKAGAVDYRDGDDLLAAIRELGYIAKLPPSTNREGR